MSEKSWKIINTSPIPKAALTQLMQAFGGVTGIDITIEDIDRSKGEDSVVEKVADADIIIGDFTFQIPLTEKTIAAQQQLKLVQQPSAGFQQIDVKAFEKAGIPVCSTGSANAEPVAEFTIMAALTLLKSAKIYSERTHRKKWTEPLEIRSRELKGKQIGILGLGRIGREVAKRFQPFAVKLFYYDIFRNEDAEKELGVSYLELIPLLKKVDILTVHLPLTSKTKDLISGEELKVCKPSLLIVQVARGGVINEAALLQALKNHKIGAAWIDVFSEEPLPDHSPFFEAPNLILTPHMAGVTEEARQRIIQAAMGNIARCLKGEPLQDIVKSYE